MTWRSLVVSALMLLLVVPLYGYLHRVSWEQRDEVRRLMPAGYTLPPSLVRVLAFGYHGLFSDMEFLRAMNFYGSRSVEKQQMSDEDWDYVYHLLAVVSELDPYFLDNYLFAAGLLTWDAQRFDDANRLLKRGMKYRDWDWQLPFYVGFNYFYFLNDNTNGGHYWMQAAQLPGSPTVLSNMAARITYLGSQSRTALAFLQQMLSETQNEAFKQKMSLRLTALQNAVMIEDAIELFKKEQGRPPALDELTEAGYLDEMPEEPYGGEWILLPSGRVYSTSKFIERRQK